MSIKYETLSPSATQGPGNSNPASDSGSGRPEAPDPPATGHVCPSTSDPDY